MYVIVFSSVSRFEFDFKFLINSPFRHCYGLRFSVSRNTSNIKDTYLPTCNHTICTNTKNFGIQPEHGARHLQISFILLKVSCSFVYASKFAFHDIIIRTVGYFFFGPEISKRIVN